ncbi:MAG TPA: VTT domain-containing protein [Nitrososphaeraceae archaeon]
MVGNIIIDLFEFFGSFGYVGILLISFVGSIIVFIPLPYFPILITATFNKQLEPNLISLSSAAGVVAAKILIFYVSYYGNNILNVGTKKRILPLQRLLSRYGWLGAFIAALTPIPDDLVYIPLGFAKYNPLKFASAVFAGKFLLNEGIVWGAVVLGRPFIESLNSNTSTITPSQIIIGIAAGVAILAIILYLTIKADWANIIGKWFPWTIVKEEEGSDEPRSDDKT